jgi:hypothetical protein
LKGFSDYSVNHVCRSGNGLAHSLAKDSCENKCNRSWVDVSPYFIVDLLASKCVVNYRNATFDLKKENLRTVRRSQMQCGINQSK